MSVMGLGATKALFREQGIVPKSQLAKKLKAWIEQPATTKVKISARGDTQLRPGREYTLGHVRKQRDIMERFGGQMPKAKGEPTRIRRFPQSQTQSSAGFYRPHDDTISVARGTSDPVSVAWHEIGHSKGKMSRGKMSRVTEVANERAADLQVVKDMRRLKAGRAKDYIKQRHETDVRSRFNRKKWVQLQAAHQFAVGPLVAVLTAPVEGAAGYHAAPKKKKKAGAVMGLLGGVGGGFLGVAAGNRLRRVVRSRRGRRALPVAGALIGGTAGGAAAGASLRGFEFSELSPLAKSVWRHYYGKLKKQTRGGKLNKSLAGYLPDDGQASKSGLLWRGTNKAEIESLASRKRFKSKWTNANYPDRPRTYVAGSPHKASSYALVSGGDRPPRAANWKDFKKHLVQSTKDARIYGISKTAYRRADNDVRSMVGDFAATAPLKGGIKASEVRALLKPSGVVREPIYGSRAVPRYRWKPVPLGAIQKKQFSRIDRGVVAMSSENLAKRRRRDPIGVEGGIPLTGQVAHDRYVLDNRRRDIAKRDSNILRAGVGGAVAGAALGGKLPLKARLAVGALTGAGSVLGVRAYTHNRGRDAYGGRQPWASRAEAAPAAIAAGAAGYGVYRALRKKFVKMSDGRQVTEFDKKKGPNPYVLAGLSGAASGALLGAVPILRKGWKAKSVAKSMATSAAVSGAIVGGGAAVGSKIIGPPKANEGSAFTKRAAIGGVLVGAGTGAAGGLLLRSRGLRSGLASVRRQTSRMPSEAARKIGAAPHRGVRSVQRGVKDLAKEWSPMDAIQKAGPLQASVLGAGAGGAYGLYQGADEGQQVDSIRNFRKDAKRYGRALSARVGTVELEKDWRDARRESRATAWRDAGAGTGALVSGVGVGGGAAYAGWRAGKALNQIGATAADARKVTRSARVANVKITRASRWIKRQLTTFPTFRKLRVFGASGLDQFGNIVELDGYNLYYFRGRNTGIAARSAKEAREKKRRGGDELVAVRKPTATEQSQMRKGIWVRTRRDGKAPGKSRFGKGRGYGPPREMSALIEMNDLRGWRHDKGYRGSLAPTLGAFAIGATVNTAAAVPVMNTLAKAHARAPVIYSPRRGGGSDLPKRSQVLDRFARRKGFAPTDSGTAAVAYSHHRTGGDRGKFLRPRHAPDFIRAHEAGHVGQTKYGTSAKIKGRIASKFAPVGALAGAVNTDPSNDKTATMIAAAGTAAAAPVMASEIGASARGYKIMRRLGASRGRALGSFAGVPTYASIAAIPALAWGLRKRSQAKHRKEARALSAVSQTIEMNDRTYRPGSTAEIRSMRPTPAMKELLKKENARGKWAQRVRTLLKVLPFEARHEFQTAPMVNPYDERERLKRNLIVTGAATVPVAGVGYAGYRSLKKSAAAMQREEARRTMGKELRLQRAAAGAVGGEVRRGKTGPRGAITRQPMPMRKTLLPETLERNAATNKAIEVGKRYESAINTRTKTRPLIRPEGEVVLQKYKTTGADGKVTDRERAKWRGGKWKTAGKSKEVFVHSRGERMKMRAALAALRTKYKFARKDGLHEFDILARDAETGRAASFWHQVQGRRLTRKNPLTGEVEDAPITTRSFISSARRETERLNRTRRRGTGLVKDVSEVMQGKRTKKREWEKGWFRRGAENVAGAGALLAGALVYKRGLNQAAPKWARTFRAALDPTNKHGTMHPKDWRGPSLTARAQKRRAVAEDWIGKKLNLSARLHNSVRMFAYQDYYAAPGWDLRDARGNSARVFSPRAKKRMRRQAEWHEKKDGQRKLLIGAGLLGGVATGTAGLLIGRRFPIKKADALKPPNIITFPKKTAS